MILMSVCLMFCFGMNAEGETTTGRFVWIKDSPENHGMDAAKLDRLKDSLAKRGTKTFLVVRDDRIVYEWYADGFDENRLHYTASLAKALVGGMSLAVALDDGRIDADDPACKYVESWKSDPLRSKITIRHLATHTSGIQDAEQPGIPHSDLPGWMGAFWRRDPDPFTISRDQAPVIFEPGTKYHYSNPGMAVLAYCVTAALRDAPESDILTLLRKRIMQPIGAPDGSWSIGYGRAYEVDGMKLYANWGGGGFTARTVARVGRLMLRKGNWEGKQLISARTVEKVLSYAGMPLPDRPEGNPQPASGLCWYTNFDGVWSKVPRDAFAGAGAGNQVLLVVPSLNLIVVRNGSNLYDESKGEGFWGGIERYLFNPIIDCVRSVNSVETGRIPYPKSPVIIGVSWDPPERIIRMAKGKGSDGSDNFPLTWADDDSLYMAYGDGYGFDPIVPDKLGLGFARIVGMPGNLTAENIRSDAENHSMGRRGKKASSLLMVDGVLYMWARNADGNGNHSQLAWSTDGARSWKWADWKFTEFGYPVFINFGRNYSGVPVEHDGYVYFVSHDNPSAYETADSFVLARVPRDKIRERDAYMFLEKVESGMPVWTKDIAKRGEVFRHPGRCRRSGITYNAGLGRYLWWQQITDGSEDTRFKGGFAVFDAPQPWGPWTTVYYTDEWDVGPGETGSFPTKWMSQDGRECYLVFSGNDNFSVRRVVFTIAERATLDHHR